MKRSARSLWHKAMVALVIVVALQLLMGATVSNAAPPASGPVYHVVRWGETLSSIGRLYGVSAWAIARANSLWNPDLIYVGQVLYIPIVHYPPYPPYPPPYPGWHCTHIVRPCETLTGIAWRYGTTVWAIARANSIWNPNLIYVNQRLTVPCLW